MKRKYNIEIPITFIDEDITKEEAECNLAGVLENLIPLLAGWYDAFTFDDISVTEKEA